MEHLGRSSTVRTGNAVVDNTVQRYACSTPFFARCLGALLASMLAFVNIARAQESVQAQQQAPDAKAVAFFEQRIRPVFIEHCYECHSATKSKGGLRLDSRGAVRKGGDSGHAVIPGDADNSLLIKAISYKGDFHDMPPDGKLPEQAITDFRRWIELGAADPRDETPPSTQPQSTTAEPAIDASEHWAFQPIERPAAPAVKHEDWPREDIDRFILAKLEHEGLAPAPDADRYTLLRRVTFDLTGLPPTPEEINAFINDSSPDAYEQVVDRLLASQAFGDHWARHWFDLSCYADLADIDGNILIRDAWRYRDYVINAMNADKPLDQFITEQIAGDLLPYDSIEQHREQIIATGFLAIGPWTLQNYIKGQLQADVVDHQIDQIGRTFLGMSLGCARCHDHKFDPVPTRDYYALAGIFNSTLTTSYDGPGVWSRIAQTTLPETSAQLKAREEATPRYKATIAHLKQRQIDLDKQRQQLRTKLTALIGDDTALQVPANTLTLATPIAANKDGQTYTVTFDAGPTVWGGESEASAESDGLRIEILRPDATALASRVHHPGRWSAKPDAQTLQAASFVYTGDGSGDVTIRIAPAVIGEARFGGAIDNLRIASPTSQVFHEDFNGYTAPAGGGKQVHTDLAVHFGGTVPGWTGGGINHSHAVEITQGDFAVQLFGGKHAAPESIEPGTDEQRQLHDRIVKINNELNGIPGMLSALEFNQPAPPRALAVRDIEAPADSPILIRGDFRTAGEVVPRGALTAVSAEAEPAIPPTSSGRRELATWITNPDNPLTPRVMANRIWQHVFGYGLARSVDYFGVRGETPSHPQLLDHLALQLLDDHWSLKQTIRHLVLSRTYQMSSDDNNDAWNIDPDNRLLWRMNRRRLEAESIRDAMLAVSGQLDPGRGGPSLGLDIPGNVAGVGGNVNPPTYTGTKVPDDIANRRTVYQPLLRRRPEGALEILSIFDFPHPNDITGARAQTTVATQALFLINAAFVKERAKATAQRLLAEEFASDADRIAHLYLLAINRPPAKTELDDALAFINDCEKSLQTTDGKPNNLREQAWTQFCHALIASNAFLFRE